MYRYSVYKSGGHRKLKSLLSYTVQTCAEIANAYGIDLIAYRVVRARPYVKSGS